MKFFSPNVYRPLVFICVGLMTLIPSIYNEQALGSEGEDLSISRFVWLERWNLIGVIGSGAENNETLTIKDADSGSTLGSATARDDGSWRFTSRNPDTIPCMILVSNNDGQTVSSGYTSDPPEVCTSPPPVSPGDGDTGQDPETTPPEPPAPPAEPVQGSHAGRFSSFEGTRTCLSCHEEEARQAHASVHYQWTGDATEAHGLISDVAGKMGGINDFCIYPDINWIGKLTNTRDELVDGGCAKCHAGLGAKPSPVATKEQLENIDCLICHSDQYQRTVAKNDNGDYRFVPDTDKMTVSLLQAAVNITRPSNDSCLDCHTKAGGGNNFKRGDIEEAHRNPTRDFDVHMASQANGGAGLKCLDCHAAANHRIAGRGTDLRPRDLPDPVNCTDPSTILAKPKSLKYIQSRSSTRMLLGLMSRWRMPFS
jgi:hypothetical protein